MSDDEPVFVQLVELLGVAEAVANDEPVVVITIRPDPPNFWPHNIALTMTQAWRLMIDLQNLMIPFVLLVSVLATTAGCGARVELESAKWGSSSGGAAKAAVDVDLLRTRVSVTGNHQIPKGILFDIGDTLLYQESLDPVLGLDRLLQLATNSAVIDAAGFRETGRRLFLDVVSWRLEIRECGLNHIELRFQSFLRLLVERFGLEMERDHSDLELEFWKAACPMLPEPGIHAVLNHLDDCGIPTGVVSNTVFSSRTVEWELARHGLTEHLSFVMASADYGVRKPHADLFLTAVRKLGLSPCEVWYVGNSLEADIAGAGEAGLVPVWYTRRVKDPSHFDGLSFEHWDAFLGLLKAS